MKKLTLLLVSFFAVFALGLTGCSDDPDVKQETPVIKASNPADIAAVAGNEILLFYFRTDNQFGFHTVGTDLRRGKVLGFTAQ